VPSESAAPAGPAGEPHASKAPLNVIVIPHSHWDREWYATFEEFRFYLVQFMDELLEILENDEGLRSFMLDGQVSLVEDYLEVRPEQRGLIRRYASDGRLEIGPWYVQPDEFLISGESLVRNLLLGDRAARAFGPVMKQGYVPDTFGHVSQLPQIFRGFDIGTFYAMRGLAEDIEQFKTEFWWESPDGSKVLAHFLSETYSNAAVLGPDPKKMSFRHDRLSDPSSYFVRYDSLYELRDRLASRAAGNAILLLNGSDHVTVQPRFSRHVFGLNRAMEDHVFNGKLADFERLVLEGAPELKTYEGELRWSRYQPILRGVFSSRMHLKQHNEATQQLLEGLAERAAAVLYSLGGRDYSPFLTHAWRTLIKNHAHDSIGGCSADAVHRQMMNRYDTATRIGQKVMEEALDQLAARLAPSPGPDAVPVAVFNPSPWSRGGLVRVEVSLDADVPFRRRIFDWIGEREINLEESVLLDPDGNEVPFVVRGETLHIEDALYRRKAVRRATIEFAASDLPPLGYKFYSLESAPEDRHRGPRREPPKEARLENEQLTVTAKSNGTLSILHKPSGRLYEGLNRLVDEGDAGDEYNFSPPSAQKVALSTASEWEVEPGEDPRTLVLRGAIELPRSLTTDRSARTEETVRCPATVRVRLVPGSRRVEIRTELYNRARDHRLRAVFPSGITAGESTAETAFGTIRRPTRPREDDAAWREKDSTLYAQRRFVYVEDESWGVGLLNKGLPEYEVSPEGELRLTLLRSVGWLSRSDLTTRIGHAGPALATPEAQCQGRHVFEYALVFHEVSHQEPGMFREAEEYWLPIEARAVQQQDLPGEPTPQGAPGSFLEIEGEDAVLSCLKKAEDRDGLILRLYNASRDPSKAMLKFGFPIATAYRTNLNEEILEEVAPRGNKLDVELRGADIETFLVRLRRPRWWAQRLQRISDR
jgi:mannosylglycerate hydrolase